MRAEEFLAKICRDRLTINPTKRKYSWKLCYSLLNSHDDTNNTHTHIKFFGTYIVIICVRVRCWNIRHASCCCMYFFSNYIHERVWMRAYTRKRAITQSNLFWVVSKAHLIFAFVCVCVCVIHATFMCVCVCIQFWLITSYLTCSGWKSIADTIVFLVVSAHSQNTRTMPSMRCEISPLNKFHIESSHDWSLDRKIWKISL